MFVTLDFFGLNNGAVFKTILCHPNYNKLEAYNAVYDQIYVDEDITIPYKTEKPDGWNYRTVLNAKLNGSLEGGSVQAGGLQIEKVRIQKRKTNELQWNDVAELDYKIGEQVLYEAIDKYIQNDFSYQYSIIPSTATVLGNRVLSNEITADFEGVFLSDKNNNYRLFYDVEFGAMQHNNPSSVLEPLNARYPIVTHSNLDYINGDITALFLSANTVNNNNIDIRMEKLGRDQLLRFIKNRKPKVLRDHNGNSMLIAIVDNPQEQHHSSVQGIATISFSYVEIGNIDGETLRENGMLEGLEEVF